MDKEVLKYDNKITAFFNEICNQSSLPVFIVNLKTEIIKVNNATQDLLRYNENEIIHKKFTDFIEKSDDLNIFGLLERLTKKFTHEIKLKPNRAAHIWALIEIIPFNLISANKLFFVQILNISKIASIQEKFISEYSLLHQLINSIPDNIFAKDIESKFILANNWVAKLMGANSPEDLIGKSDFDFYSQEMAQQYYNDEQEIIKTGKSKIGIVEKVYGLNNEIFWYSTTKTPIYDSNGDIVGTMGIGRNITASIREREELKKAKDDAEKANTLKSTFLANISHEIRTPLNAILGFSQVLQSGNLIHEEPQKYLQIIQFNGKQLLGIINDLLDMSRIVSGEIKLSHKTIKLNTLMNNLYEIFNQELTKLRKDNIVLELNCPLKDEDSFILSDNLRLQQILNNLLSNAVKFTFNGKIEFGYKIENEKWINFYVKDTGIGIEIEKQEMILEAFRQADESLTRNYGGTGIGLSISKGLIELFGGQLNIKSEPGQGSIFSFSIPYIKDQSINNKLNDEIKKSLASIGDRTVLVIEKDKELYSILNDLCTLTKIKIIHCDNEICTQSLIEKGNKIHLIFINIESLDFDEYEALKTIKKLDDTVLVIAYNNFANVEDIRKYLKFGFDECLMQPVDYEGLSEFICKLLI